MALWGKGDPRWIVEERPDSTNVNNWHWTERDGTAWSKEKLKELFLNVKDECDEGSWAVNEVKTLEGEATINNRKGKLIFFYEWIVKLGYKGKLADSELEHSGNIHIPNLSDENTADDVDVEITAKGDSKNAERLKQIVRRTGIKLCREKCQNYITDLKTEYSAGMVLPTKNENTNKNSNTNTSKQTAVSKDMKDLKFDDNVPKKQPSCHFSLNLSEEFKTTADELYATLTLAERLSAFTRSPCTSDPSPGGTFSVMNDNINGSYVELIPAKKIVQKWRFKEWPSDVFSVVTITLEQKSDCTMLRLSQTGVPDYDTVRTEEGWKQHFWGPIKQVFGFGAQLF